MGGKGEEPLYIGIPCFKCVSRQIHIHAKVKAVTFPKEMEGWDWEGLKIGQLYLVVSART